MRSRVAVPVVVLTGLLLVSALAVGLFGQAPTSDSAQPIVAQDASTTQAAADASVAPNATASAGDDAPAADPVHEHDHGSGVSVQAARPQHDHFRSGEEGRVPARADAPELPIQLENFVVESDRGLARMLKAGYIHGSGSIDDPYIIEGFRVRDDLSIKDTSKAIVIRNSLIEGQLTLNYNGPNVYVHHNRIHDLRVNENVARDGDTTAGLFEHNEIAFIGQIRHFSGEFRSNDIGPRPDGVITTYLSDSGPQDLDDGVVWNFDGYHAAHVHNNTVLGRVDVKLHGHYHGSGPLAHAHDHADPAGFPEDNEADPGSEPRSSHSVRFHTLDFEQNTIRADGTTIALRFYDRAHAADDRTANSEPNAYLEDLHRHHTYLRISGNTVRDGSLVLDVVDPADQRHKDQTVEALVDLVGNSVTLDRPRGSVSHTPEAVSAYVVHQASTLTLRADGNQFEFIESDSAVPNTHRWIVEPPAETSGFHIDQSKHTVATISRTTGSGATYGVTVSRSDSSVDVTLHDNRFNAQEEMHRA